MGIFIYWIKNIFISIFAFPLFLFNWICPINLMRISVDPVVFECGADYYAVVWVTSLKGSGYVSYTYNGEEKILWDAPGGIVATDDTIHVVKVPKEELQNNTYKVGSQFVAFKYGYHALKGRKAESEEFNFKGAEKEDDIKILAISDIHEMEKTMRKSIAFFEEEPDLVCMIGDITSEMRTKGQFTKFVLKDAAQLSKSSVPVVFTRGNHETRGEFGARLLDYLPTQTGEFYFTFDFGGLSAMVLDSGEDKADDHKEYSGLIDFDTYREKEHNWLTSLEKEDFDGKYKIVFCHDPFIGEDYFGKDWLTPLKNLDMDIIVGGHHHQSKLEEGELPGFDVCGKYDKDKWAASMLTLKDGKISMLTINNEGETLLDKTIDAE